MEVGPKESAPLMVVLLLPARSAEPPHSSGSLAPSAESVSPEAARVATALEPGSQDGSPASQPCGNARAWRRSSSALRSGSRAAQASKLLSHSACACLPRVTSSRVCAMTSGATSKDLSGSKPKIFLVAATSSAPRAEPCTPPVFILVGAG
ncbi:Uncharacterised protein [Mycobacteroides abscessus]|nr:Uncharacterised protein [Mycobacteroides abscessus]SKP22387.1 Uncharacterised protein [Mycobacteroides abscessus subsp. abscessus]